VYFSLNSIIRFGALVVLLDSRRVWKKILGVHLENLYVWVFEIGYDSYKLNFRVKLMKINLVLLIVFMVKVRK